MTQITCPKCGKPISSSATSCPNCGYVNKRKATFGRKSLNLAICGLLASYLGLGIQFATEGSYKNRERWGDGYVAGKTTGSAIQFGGAGVAIGCFGGPLGSAIGGGLGAVVGIVFGDIQSQKKALPTEIAYDHALVLRGDYTYFELKEIYDYLSKGKRSNNSKLRSKLEYYGDKTGHNALQSF